MKPILAALQVLCLACPATAGPDAFEYREWTNKDGRALEARLDRIDGATVILQVKKGGKRYPLKKDGLSDDSKKHLGDYIDQTKSSIAALKKEPGAVVPGSLVYKAAALGLEKEILSLRGRWVSFTISDIRVDKRLTAILEFHDGCFHTIQSPDKREFFIKQDTLYLRSSTRGENPYIHHGVDRRASEQIRPDSAYTLRIEAGTKLTWDRIGVSEGPVIR